jgi:hypothetical protein
MSAPTSKTVQEFLKRIPSATALSSQHVDDNQTLFGSTSTNSLFGFGTAAAGTNEANMHKVASLDMLRTLCEQRVDNAKNSESHQGASASFPQQGQQPFQPGQQRSQAASNGFATGAHAMQQPSQMPATGTGMNQKAVIMSMPHHGRLTQMVPAHWGMCFRGQGQMRHLSCH